MGLSASAGALLSEPYKTSAVGYIEMLFEDGVSSGRANSLLGLLDLSARGNGPLLGLPIAATGDLLVTCKNKGPRVFCATPRYNWLPGQDSNLRQSG